MTEADRHLGIEICKRFPVDLADVQGIIEMVRGSTIPRAELGADALYVYLPDCMWVYRGGEWYRLRTDDEPCGDGDEQHGR